MTEKGIALANAAKASILSPDEAIRPSGISPEALVAAENVLGTGPAAGFGQSRRDWRTFEGRKQRETIREVARPLGIPGEFVADEGEHSVHFNPTDGLAHKATNNSRFGFVLDQDEWDAQGKLSPRPALPSEYLWRLGLQNVVFGDAIQLTGIARSPEGPASIHTAQPWVEGTAPTLDEIAGFMASAGFVQVPGELFAKRVPKNLAWYRASDGVLAYDAKPNNFSKNTEGAIDPIDLVISLYPRELLEDTAKRSGSDWSLPGSPSLSLTSADILERIAPQLAGRGRPPKERRQMYEAAQLQVEGMARSMRHNDSLGKPPPKKEMLRSPAALGCDPVCSSP